MASVEDVIKACTTTPFPGSGLCAKWVRLVFKNAGVGNFYGNAEDYFKSYCKTNVANVKPGMILACDDSPSSTYGHVGIYIGNNKVMESVTNGINTQSLSSFVSWYSKKTPVKCGWLGNIELKSSTTESEGFNMSTLPTLHKGSTNRASIKALQALLNGYGYELQRDGYFGEATKSALGRYQKAQGLAVDYYCGTATWSKLLGVS